MFQSDSAEGVREESPLEKIPTNSFILGIFPHMGETVILHQVCFTVGCIERRQDWIEAKGPFTLYGLWLRFLFLLIIEFFPIEFYGIYRVYRIIEFYI